MKASGKILGIGVSSIQTKKATVGMKVKKAGGGTGVTQGTVTAVNVTGKASYVTATAVGFDLEVANFKNQIVVWPDDPSESIYFPEDSGSLVVENKLLEIPGVVGVGLSMDESRHPVILLLLESDSEATRAAIPAEIGGFATDVLVTGAFQMQ